MPTIPYLSFDGRCEEAIEFYRKAVGARVEMLMRFKEAPEQPPPGTMPAGTDDKIMHASLTIGGSPVMASDGYCKGKPNFAGVELTLTVDDEAAARRHFDALADGGKVTMPMAKTFWSPAFGSLTDRFGLGWMVMVEQKMQG